MSIDTKHEYPVPGEFVAVRSTWTTKYDLSWNGNKCCWDRTALATGLEVASLESQEHWKESIHSNFYSLQNYLHRRTPIGSQREHQPGAALGSGLQPPPSNCTPSRFLSLTAQDITVTGVEDGLTDKGQRRINKTKTSNIP